MGATTEKWRAAPRWWADVHAGARATNVQGEEDAQRRTSGSKGFRRGDAITVVEHFYGRATAAEISLAGPIGPGRHELVWQGGFGMWERAHELVAGRNMITPLLADAEAVEADTSVLSETGLVASGSPCQQASRVPHIGKATEPDAEHPLNQYYWKQAQWFTRHADGAVVEFLASVKQLRSPGKPEKAAGWLNAKLLAVLREAGWRTVQWDFNAAYHGSCAARRRLYTLTFSPRAAVAAAQRAKVELEQQPAALHPDERKVVLDALFEEATIEEHHRYLFTLYRAHTSGAAAAR